MANQGLDQLPSWTDGAVKSKIMDFVTRITREDGSDFVRPAERIAVFDNDGTLWCEHPLQVQFYFGHDRLKALVDERPELQRRCQHRHHRLAEEGAEPTERGHEPDGPPAEDVERAEGRRDRGSGHRRCVRR